MVDGLRMIEESGVFTNNGPVNARLEASLSDDVFGHPESVVTCCNATIALMLAMKDVIRTRRRARYVLMPSFTFAAAAQAAEWLRLAPLLCDIEPDSWTPCAASEERLIARHGDDIALILPYATFGAAIDLGRYAALSRRTGIPVVVDAAASMGTTLPSGRPFGAGAPCPVIFSMHATKVFGIGEGGFIHCADTDVVERIRRMANFGFEAPRVASLPGLNGKLPEVAALIALEKMKTYVDATERRVQLAALYRQELPDWQFQAPTAGRQAHAMMPVLPPDSFVGSRQSLIDGLAQAGIGSAAYFAPHLAQHPHLARHVVTDTLRVTDHVSSRLVGLPLWDGLTDEAVRRICREARALVELGAGMQHFIRKAKLA